MTEKARIKTLLVDDEYLALNLLENFINQVPGLEIVAKVKSPMQALEILREQPVDLLFLDIQMPTLSGNNLLKTLPNPPLTIFTTAYADYAIEAFDLNAVDYLLKPISFERFLQAVHKAKEQLQFRRKDVVEEKPEPTKDFLIIKADGIVHKVFLKDIFYIESLREYVRVVTGSDKLVYLESMKKLEETLPSAKFMRVHKSFIIAKDKVRALNGNMLEIGNHRIPVARRKQAEVRTLIFGMT